MSSGKKSSKSTKYYKYENLLTVSDKKVVKRHKTSKYHSSKLDELHKQKPLMLNSYINNRYVLLDELFKSLKNKKIMSMIPDILQRFSLTQIKVKCLAELSKLSNEEIIKILNDEHYEILKSQNTSSISEKSLPINCNFGEPDSTTGSTYEVSLALLNVIYKLF